MKPPKSRSARKKRNETKSATAREPARASASNSRRRRAIVGVIVVVAIAAFFILRNDKRDEESAKTKDETFVPLPPPSIVAPPPPMEHASAAPSSSEEPLRAPPMDRVSFNKRKAEMAQNALNDVNTWMKYPLWSSPLTKNMQYEPPVPVRASMGGPGAGGYPKLELYMGKVNYAPGETVKVYAEAHGPDGLIDFDAITGKTTGLTRERPEIILDWVEQPNHSYVATLAITSELARKNRGEWGINVDCQISGEHRVMHTVFYEMATDATVTGPYRVAVENGSLSVFVGINATVLSRQHLKGELWTPRGDPVAYAWVRNDQTPVGNSEMKLVFYGKTIRDAGFDGPYVVKNLLLTTFDDNNDRIQNDVVDPKLVTPAFKKEVFTDVPINGNDPVLNEKKQILEGELKKAQGNGYDPAHPDPAPTTRTNKNTPPPQ